MHVLFLYIHVYYLGRILSEPITFNVTFNSHYNLVFFLFSHFQELGQRYCVHGIGSRGCIHCCHVGGCTPAGLDKSILVS